MKRCLLVLLLGLGLAACNDNDHDDQVSTEKPALAPSLDVGTYIISTETDEELPMAGKYYSGADGSKLLVLDDDENRAKIVMSYDAKTKAWRSNQSNQAMTVELAHYEKIADQKLLLNQLVGTYDLSFPDGTTVNAEVSAQGKIVSKDPNCVFTGVITESALANTANYQLTNNKCDALKNNSKGYVVVDEDLEPMSFRLVSDTIASKDIWAFAQS
ncbi:hypothetical protein V8Q10_04065 [Acinetobacter baumannii]